LVLVEFREKSGLVADQRLSGFSGDGFIGFDAAVAANVEHGMAALCEHAADEQAAVAMSGILLAANQGHAEALHAGLQTGDGCLKMGVLAKPAIEDAAFGVVVGRVGWATAQLRAKKEIAYPRFLQRTLHEFPVELRNVL
jgi:hypothetical protein